MTHLLNGFSDHLLSHTCLGQIDIGKLNFAAALFNQTPGVVPLSLAEGGNENIGAGFGHGDGIALAQPSVTTGDDGHFARQVEFVHVELIEFCFVLLDFFFALVNFCHMLCSLALRLTISYTEMMFLI